MQNFKVWWSPQSLEDIKKIYEYIYEQSPKGADIVFDTLLDLGDSLNVMPERFPIDPFVSSEENNFRFITKWDYKIFYRINPKIHTVIIARIFSSRQHPNKLKI